MASVKAMWVARELGASALNPTITMQRRISHYMGAMLPAKVRKPEFLSVSIHDTDRSTQYRARLERKRLLSLTIFADLTAVLHEVSPNLQTFRSLREWAHHEEHPAPYQMVTHANRRSAPEHARRYNGPERLGVAAIIFEKVVGDVGTRDIFIH